MKPHLWLCLAALATFCISAHAQLINGKITGTIRDAQNKSLGGVAIILQEKADSTIKTTDISDSDGAFVFKNLRKGDYILLCIHIGFNIYKSGTLTITEKQPVLRLPLLILQESNPKELKEVKVTAKKPLIEQHIDRLIVNVDAMLTAAGNSALEVLSQSPGVMVSSTDDISLNGKRNVLVLIDDRPTYMSSQDLALYLRSLPAGLLDKVELISNPPARYDAAGGAIINIILKKNKASGLNGSLNLGYNQGAYGRSNNALILNYRTKKRNVFGNGSYGRDRNFTDETYNRYFYSDTGPLHATIFQTSHSSYTSNGWNGRIGMDFFASPKTTVGVLFTISSRLKTDRLDYTINQHDVMTLLDSVNGGYNSGRHQSDNAGMNLNLSHKFDSTGKTLTANLDLVNYLNNTDQLSPIMMYGPDGQLAGTVDRWFVIPSSVHIYAGKVDYSQPMAGKTELSAGLKSSYVTNSVDSDWLNLTQGHFVPDYGKSNHFRYSENINAAYVNVKKEWSRWGLQVGLRMENTRSKGHQLANPAMADTIFTKSYTRYFPSVHLLYKLDKEGDNTFALSYGKGIKRPGYRQLNPFLFFIDQYSYTGGNPNLVPGHEQAVELRYIYKHYIGATIVYSDGKGEINPVTKVIGGKFITRFQNLSQNRFFGIIPNLTLSPASWWKVNASALLLAFRNSGIADGVLINQKSNLHEIEVTNQFQLGKTWSAELSGFFPGKQFFIQTKTSSCYSINAGLQKNIWEGKGTIRLTANDIFYSMVKNSQIVSLNKVSAFTTRRSDSRRIGISFSYRFGKDINARKRNITGSAEDEKLRTN